MALETYISSSIMTMANCICLYRCECFGENENMVKCERVSRLVREDTFGQDIFKAT